MTLNVPTPERLEELLKKATPGPWEAGRNITCEHEGSNCSHIFEEEAYIFPPTGEAGPVAVVAQRDSDNAALIVALRNSADWLIARLRAAEGLAGAVRKLKEDSLIALGHEVNEALARYRAAEERG